MRKRDGSFSDSYNNYCLVENDVKLLREKIASLNSQEVVDENIRLKVRSKQLMTELKSEKEKRRTNSAEVKEKSLEIQKASERELLVNNAFSNLANAAGEDCGNIESLIQKWQKI
jgi:hypothetical protein